MKIKATAERIEILDDNNIFYQIDTDLNFIFKCPKEETRAKLILESALAL